MAHKCHWPGCGEEVHPRLWGCKRHWYTLPPEIRRRILLTYKPGQEVNKDPSPEYMEAAKQAREFAIEWNRKEIRENQIVKEFPEQLF